MDINRADVRRTPSWELPAGWRASVFGLAAGVLAAALWFAAQPAGAPARSPSTGADGTTGPGGFLSPSYPSPEGQATPLPWWADENLSPRAEAITSVAGVYFKRGDLDSARVAVRSIADPRERDIAVNAILDEALSPLFHFFPGEPDGDRIGSTLSQLESIVRFSAEIRAPSIKAIGLSRVAEVRRKLGAHAREPTFQFLAQEALKQALAVPPERVGFLGWVRSAVVAVSFPLLAFVATNIGAALFSEVGKGVGKAFWTLRGRPEDDDETRSAAVPATNAVR